MGKILEKKPIPIIKDYSMFAWQQFRFKKEHNTIEPLLQFGHFVKSNFNSRSSTGMVLLNIKAAFDSIWHDTIISKMLPFEIVKITQSLLKDKRFNVYLGSASSHSIVIGASCARGSCLSSIIYIIFSLQIFYYQANPCFPFFLMTLRILVLEFFLLMSIPSTSLFQTYF